MSDIVLPLPSPLLSGPYQSGIVDPIWPPISPVPAVPQADYDRFYAGQVERQRHLHLVTADLHVQRRSDVVDAMKALTRFARHQMEKSPKAPDRPHDARVQSQRVTVTIGIGATLFNDRHGDDRFGLAGMRPSSLKCMPKIEGDDGFIPRDHATDLVVVIQSDDVYVNEYLVSLLMYGHIHPGIRLQHVERGYARPDSREPSGFEDGISNPKGTPPDDPLRSLVFVQKGDTEPEWCEHGTYLAFRKIRRRMASFFQLSPADREEVFGVDPVTGDRIPRAAASSHAQKMNPRRTSRDLFNRLDESRRFLRRPYFYDDGLDDRGEENRGVHHLSFVRDLVTQYEWPVLMWQTNPDFPVKGAGMDALFRSHGGAANVGGGYYFMPSAPADKADFIASGIFA